MRGMEGGSVMRRRELGKGQEGRKRSHNHQAIAIKLHKPRDELSSSGSCISRHWCTWSYGPSGSFYKKAILRRRPNLLDYKS